MSDLHQYFISDSDTDTDIDVEPNAKRKCLNMVDQKICEISKTHIQNRLPYRCVSEVTKLMNEMPGAQISIPDTKTAFKQSVIDLGPEKYLVLVFCSKCNELVEESNVCECGQIVKRNSKKNNFLIHFPIIPQIKRQLHKHFEKVMSHLHRQRSGECIKDIDDCTLFKTRQEKSDCALLTLTMNIDGAQVFNSSGGSLWPEQFYCNFLPPEIRYKTENILVSTLYFGKTKPDPEKLLFPVGKELDVNTFIYVLTSQNETLRFKLGVLLIACDLPARASIQNFVGSAGRYSCPYCKQIGSSIPNMKGSTTIRLLKHQNCEPRTHRETVKVSRICSNGNNIEGCKGISSALMFNEIDLIQSFSIDSMHGIALGITKHIIEIWIGKKAIPKPPFNNYKIKKKKNREILNQRILKLKPPTFVHRKPRSIYEVSNFKASELFNFLWFYLRYSITGLLPTKVVKHFEKLSAATYMLYRDSLSLSEVKSACDLLTEFANEFEDIYGAGAITLNIHLLRHYYDMIIACGPLWAYTVFGFEAENGVLTKYVCGKTDVLLQIASKYTTSRMHDNGASKVVSPETNSTKPNSPELSYPTNISVKMEYVNVLNKAKIVLSADKTLKVWKRLKFHGDTFTSISANQGKSIDYFVKLRNGHIGVIHFYIESEKIVWFLLQIYQEDAQNYHYTEVRATDEFELMSCCEIEEKMMYFKQFGAEFITRMPNRYPGVLS